MAPKRKSDVDSEEKENSNATVGTLDNFVSAPATKKQRVSDEATTSAKGKSKGKPEQTLNWQDVTLEGEDEGEVPVFDNCNDIRRKIRALQKQPGFKITHWLKDIGNINSNSLSRFMKATGPAGGAENGTYYAAYVYFEKVRIASGKKKTPKRIDTEAERGGGLPLEDRRRQWVFVGHRN